MLIVGRQTAWASTPSLHATGLMTQWQLRALLVRMERPPAVAAGVSMECLIALQFEGRYICYFLCCFHEIVTLRSEASVVELAEEDLF